jgi:hypothetical protein
MRRKFSAMLAVATFCMLPVVEAHTGGTGYVDVLAAQDPAAPRLQVDVALPDVAAALRLDRDADGRLRWREVTAAQVEIATFLRARLKLSSAGRPCRPAAIGQPLLVDRDTGRHLRMVLAFSCAAQGGQLSLDASPWFAEVADQGVYVSSDGASDQVALLTRDRPVAALDAQHKQGFGRFWMLGVEHLLSGYDHLAFLALLLLGAVRKSNRASGIRSLFWETTKIATAFAAAHSITLALAATGTLQVPAAPVETAIAGSIFITAVAIFAGADRWIGWPLAFGFGLVHGLGFANLLAELLSGRNLLAPLLGFNLGIEVAQLVVIAVVAPLLWQAMARPRLLRGTSAVSALLLAGLSVYWMAQRWP